MALFKHKNGRVCEVLTEENIVMLRKNSDYKEIVDKKESKEGHTVLDKLPFPI